MTGKTHRILGVSAGLTYALSALDSQYSPATLAAVLTGSYFASLIPDLDRSTADIWDNIPLGKAVGKIVDPLIKHRNISHSLLGILIFILVSYLIIDSFPIYWGVNKDIAFVSISLAYISHLLADMFTVDGIPLFYPSRRAFGIPPRPFDGIRILTGKWFENLIIFPLIDIYLVAIILIKWQHIKTIIFK